MAVVQLGWRVVDAARVADMQGVDSRLGEGQRVLREDGQPAAHPQAARGRHRDLQQQLANSGDAASPADEPVLQEVLVVLLQADQVIGQAANHEVPKAGWDCAALAGFDSQQAALSRGHARGSVRGVSGALQATPLLRNSGNRCAARAMGYRCTNEALQALAVGPQGKARLPLGTSLAGLCAS